MPQNATVTVDGQGLGEFNNCYEGDIGTVNGILYKQLTCPMAEGVHTVASNMPVGLTVYGYYNVGSYGYPGFPVLFQAELRRAIEQADVAGVFLRLFRRDPENKFVLAIATACLRLSQRRHGALIVIERETGLQEYIDTGIILNAEPSSELLLTIFNKNTELHDGGVIFRGEKIAAAACVLPLSTRSLSDRQMGLRHRAALGISEVTDAVVVIVSEETGQVSIAHNGRILRRQDPSRLDVILQAFLQNRSAPLQQGEQDNK
jgi:uncharacterized protein (TIGR00159 family)